MKRWSTCSCGHIAQEHDATVSASVAQQGPYPCTIPGCGCKDYDGHAITGDTPHERMMREHNAQIAARSERRMLDETDAPIVATAHKLRGEDPLADAIVDFEQVCEKLAVLEQAQKLLEGWAVFGVLRELEIAIAIVRDRRDKYREMVTAQVRAQQQPQCCQFHESGGDPDDECGTDMIKL